MGETNSPQTGATRNLQTKAAPPGPNKCCPGYGFYTLAILTASGFLSRMMAFFLFTQIAFGAGLICRAMALG